MLPREDQSWLGGHLQPTGRDVFFIIRTDEVLTIEFRVFFSEIFHWDLNHGPLGEGFVKGEHFGELARLPLESRPVAEADSSLLDRTVASPPKSGAAELSNGRHFFRAKWQERILLGALIFGATITVSSAAGLFKQAKAPTDEASRRYGTLIAKLENQHTAPTAEIEKARQRAAADRTELAQASEAVRVPSSDAAGLDRQLAALTAEIEKLRQQASADRAAVAQLRTQVSEAAQAHAPDAAFDRQLSQLMDLIQKVQQLAAVDSTNLTQLVEKLEQQASADRAVVAQLRTQMSEAVRTPAPDAAGLERQRTDLAAEIEKLRQEASADRAVVAQLRTQMNEAARAPAPDAGALDRQRTEFVAEIYKLRQEVSADRAAVAQLRTQVSEAARASAPDAALDRQRTETAAEIEKLRQQASADRAAVAQLRTQVNEAAPALPSIPQPRESPQFTGTGGTSPNVDLPTDAIPRIILRFARNRDSARTRAATLELSLRTQGMDVVKSEGAPASSRNEIMYFYSQDRPSAERIAAGIAEAALIQRPFAKDGSLPRPGTIEVEIGR